MSLPHSDNAAGFVLAGGESSRMGTDKALIHFSSQPLIAHSVAILRDAGLDVAIAGAQSDLSAYAPVIEDGTAGLGPLSGICAALASTSAQWPVFLSVDLPMLPPSLIHYLLFHARITGSVVTLASVNGFAQTFPSVIRRDAHSALKTELHAGRRGCFSAYQAAASQAAQAVNVLPVEMLLQSGHVVHPHGLPAIRWFSNLNSPGDVARARRSASHRVI